jgi:hypothetical protein
MICIRRIKAEACGYRRTAEDNKIAHAVAKACAENTENPCLADFGGTWVLVLGVYFCIRLAWFFFFHFNTDAIKNT